MNRQDTRWSRSAKVAVKCVAGGAACLLAACGHKVASTESGFDNSISASPPLQQCPPQQTQARATSSNPNMGATMANGVLQANAPIRIDAAAMELGIVEIAPGSDPIVGNGENPPSMSAPTAANLPSMAADVMESLAQVTSAKLGSDFDPCISRDGQVIVFASTQHRPTADIYIKTITGRTVTQLTSDPGQDVMPSLSPDGKRVAFASNRTGSWDIYVMSITGGQAVQVTNDPTQELHPSWSPDGTKIVYCRLGQVSGRWEMWVTDIEQPMAAEFIGYGLFPTWCPVAGTGDGGRDKILYQRSRERGDRAFSVWTVDYKPGDASMPTEVATNAASACINPTWSPDGQWVVYASVPFHGNDGGSFTRPPVADLWMCGVDGSARVNLTTGRSVNLMPTWGIDGRIYFVSDRGGIENVWSIGTEKAMLAARGARPASGEVTNVPDNHGNRSSH